MYDDQGYSVLARFYWVIRFSSAGLNGSKNSKKWLQFYFHLSLVQQSMITNRSITVHCKIWLVGLT